MSFSLVGSAVSLITTVLTAIGLTGVFALMVVESFGIPPLPSEVILTFAGFLVASQTFDLYGTIAAALAGGLVGSFIAYAVGRWGREWITRPRPAGLRLSERQLDRVDRWFRGRDEWIVAVARMVPVVRSYISYPAGFARMNPTRFGLYTLVGSVPFTLGLIYAGIVLRSDWSAITGWFGILDDIVIALIVVGLVYALFAYRGYLSWDWPPRRLRRGAPSPSSGSDPERTGPAP
ncbi:MAG: DedA family protein [Thermoplasmata archaeon]